MTIDPGEKEDTTVELERILSGDYMKAHLSADFIIAASQQNYINVNQSNEIGDVKPSIRADLIDREKNFAFEDVTTDEIEKPNSPVNNPALVSKEYGVR